MLRWRRFSLATPVTEQVLDMFNHVIPVKFACNRENHVIRVIACLPKITQVAPLQLLHALCRPQRESRKRTAFKKTGPGKVKDPTHGFIIASTNLLEDNAAHLL